MHIEFACRGGLYGPSLTPLTLLQEGSSYSAYFRLFPMTTQLHSLIADDDELFPKRYSHVYRDVVPLFVGPDSMLRSLHALLYG